MKPIRTAILTALYTCLAFLHASCVREDIGDCVQYQVHVRVVDAAGNDLTESGVLEKSEVYLFGDNGLYAWFRQEYHRTIFRKLQRSAAHPRSMGQHQGRYPDYRRYQAGNTDRGKHA